MGDQSKKNDGGSVFLGFVLIFIIGYVIYKVTGKSILAYFMGISVSAWLLVLVLLIVFFSIGVRKRFYLFFIGLAYVILANYLAIKGLKFNNVMGGYRRQY